MNAVLMLALVVAMQEAPYSAEASAAPTLEAPHAPSSVTLSPVELTPVAPVITAPPAPVTIERDAAIEDIDARYDKTGDVLAAFADEGKSARITGAVASGILAAGLIGAGITYVAVGNLDLQLSQKDYEDTQLAGFVIGGAALIPVSVMVAHLVSSTPEEDRYAAFEGASTRDEKAARIAVAQQSLVHDATSSSLAPTLGGIGFIGGGLVSAAVGGVFLALPHVPDVERGPMTHATGAELIGAGVASVGLGTALLFSTGSTAPLQLRLLDPADGAVASAE